MRVMHVIDTLAVGGAERMLITLANRSQADGLEVSVCSTRAGGPLVRDLDRGIPFRTLPRRRRVDPHSFALLGRFASERRTQLFHVHGRSSFSFLAAAKTAGAISGPIVLHDHNGALEPRPVAPAWMRYWGAPLVGQYVAASESVVAWAERARVPRGRIRVIENAIETNRYASQRTAGVHGDEPAPRPLTGIVVANLRPEKGIDVLLSALARLASHRRPLIWICGAARDAGYEGHCRELTAALGLCGAVHFLALRDDIGRLIARADFGVIPSISESGPLVLAEFLAAGLPVVATEAGSLARRARALGVREIVPPGDAAALSAAIGHVISLTPAERAAQGELGRELARRYFDISAVMPRWYEVYGDALTVRCP